MSAILQFVFTWSFIIIIGLKRHGTQSNFLLASSTPLLSGAVLWSMKVNLRGVEFWDFWRNIHFTQDNCSIPCVLVSFRVDTELFQRNYFTFLWSWKWAFMWVDWWIVYALLCCLWFEHFAIFKRLLVHLRHIFTWVEFLNLMSWFLLVFGWVLT